MRILVITNTLNPSFGGWGRYSVDFIKELQKKDYNISVISSSEYNKDVGDIKQFVMLPEPLNFRKTFLFTFLYVIKFLFIKRKKEKYDVIHCFIESYAFFTFVLSKILGVKYFITVHGSYGVKTLENKIYGFMQKVAYKNACKIVCVSEYTKRRMLEYIDLNNLLVIPNGLAIENIPKEVGPKEKENILLSVGALKKRKGQHLVLKSLVDIKKKIPDIKYMIVGDQSDATYLSYMKDIVSKSNLEEHVYFLGKITEEKLKSLYRESKVFILTPVSDAYNFEGFGLVYLEANAYGLPTVGSYENGGEEAIKDGYNGILTKPEDIQNISSAVIGLFADVEKYNTMSSNARIWAESMTWDKQILKYIKIYK